MHQNCFIIPIISLKALHQLYYTFNDFLIHLKRPALNNHIHTIINIPVFPIGVILSRVFNWASIPFTSRLLHRSWKFHGYPSPLGKMIILWPVLYLFQIAIHNISKRCFKIRNIDLGIGKIIFSVGNFPHFNTYFYFKLLLVKHNKTMLLSLNIHVFICFDILAK